MLNLFNKAIDISSPIKAFGNAVDKVTTSDEERLNAKIILEKLNNEPMILQNELNKIEAAHRSIFIAGWRPFIGWVCGICLCYIWLIRPMLQDLVSVFGKTIDFINIDTENMMQLIIALLGLGCFRTFEKVKDKTK